MDYIYARYNVLDEELDLWISQDDDLFNDYDVKEVSTRCLQLELGFRDFAKEDKAYKPSY